MSSSAHLQGQETDEAKESVHNQRHIKRLNDGIRKIQAKMKKATPEQLVELEKDLDKYKKELHDLEPTPVAVPAADTPNTAADAVPPVAPTPPAAAVAATEQQQEQPSVGRPSLQGQNSEEAKDAVLAQRNLKKAKDALRKIASKKKLAKTAEEMAALDEQQTSTEAEIQRLESVLGIAAEATAATAAPPQPPSTAAAAPSSVENVAMQSRPTGRRQPVPVPATAGLTPTATTAGTPPRHPPADSSSPAATAAATPSQPALPQYGTEGLSRSTMLRGRRAAVPDHAAVIHPRMAEFGFLTQTMQIVGGNARTFGLIVCLTELCLSSPLLNGTLANFGMKDRKEFDTIVSENISFVNRCRECSAGMLFVKRLFSRRLFALPSNSLGQSMAGPSSRGGGPRREASLMMESPASPLTSLAPAAFHSRSLPASTSRFLEDSPTAAGAPQRIPNQTPSNFSQHMVDDEDDLSTMLVRDVVVKILTDLKLELSRSIDCLVEERSHSSVVNGDVLLIYGRSSSVELILQRAVKQRVTFSVIILDSAPLFEGRSFAARLQALGLSVTYGLLSSVCVLLPQCTKVFFGAAAVLQNGDIVSRAGTAVVAAAAKQFRKSVMCFTESYKFVSKAWVGSLVHNAEAATVQQRHMNVDVETLLDQCMCHVSTASPTSAGSVMGLTPTTPTMQRNASPSIQQQQQSAAPVFLPYPTTPSGIAPGGGSGGQAAGSSFAVNAAIAAQCCTDRSLLPAAATMCTPSGYLYDVTPAAHVDMVVCEMGSLHSSAIAAAIRDRQDREDLLNVGN